MDIACKTYPSIANQTKCFVIRNGVDIQKFSYSKRKPGFNIAVVGDINYKKNPAMWIEVMSRLVKLNSHYTLKVAGDFQELHYKYYFENIIHKLGIEKNIKFCGRVEDIPEWFEREEINYLLTTSVFESFGYGIAEAMAMGYKPLINNFPGADANWPYDCAFSSTDELIEILNDKDNYNSREYHEFVRSRYSLSSQLDAIDLMLTDLIHLNTNFKEPKNAETEDVDNICNPTSKEFDYPVNESGGNPIYLPQKYWEQRGRCYAVNKEDYNDDVEIPNLNDLIKKHNLYDSKILEVGSGYGRIYQESGKKCSNFTMCDFSHSMRRECEKRTGILPDYWNGHKLPYPDKSFDLIILFSVLLHVPEKQIETLFSEICRVTREYIFVATYTGNLKILDSHVFEYDYHKLFKNHELKISFEKIINNGLRTNWLLKKQLLPSKLETTNINLLQTTV